MRTVQAAGQVAGIRSTGYVWNLVLRKVAVVDRLHIQRPIQPI